MSCCGGQRAELRQAVAAQTHRKPERISGGEERKRMADVEFEYNGPGQIAVTGPLTGTRYQFAARGARVLVRGPDAPSLALVPGLSPAR